MNSLRKKIAAIACIVLGPLCIIAGIYATYEDIRFMTQSVVVEGKIVEEKLIPASKGPGQVQFMVDFQPPGDELPRSKARFTVYDYQKDEVLATQPLRLRYLASSPDSLKAEKFFPQGWIPLVLGVIMTLAGKYAIGRWKKGTL